MILLATFTAVLLYLDRVCISTAGETVAQNLSITKAELDKVLGAFFVTYALGQLPAGWLGDRYGARWTLGLYIFLWSLATGLLAFARTLSALLILRLACGLFEAGAYPLAASIVRRWVPTPWRGTASAIIAVGGRLGGAVAPVMTIQLMLAWTWGSQWWSIPDDAKASLDSWRPVMGLYGLAGIVGAGFFVLLFRDWPHLHPAVNAAELRLIRGNEALHAGSSQGSSEWPPILAMVCSFPMWMNCAVQFSANLGWGFLVTKLPQFLNETFHSSQQQQGWLQSLPLAAGIAPSDHAGDDHWPCPAHDCSSSPLWSLSPSPDLRGQPHSCWPLSEWPPISAPQPCGPLDRMSEDGSSDQQSDGPICGETSELQYPRHSSAGSSEHPLPAAAGITPSRPALRSI
jgi:ACS family glucarate transporter-like MFS transporter